MSSLSSIWKKYVPGLTALTLLISATGCADVEEADLTSAERDDMLGQVQLALIKGTNADNLAPQLGLVRLWGNRPEGGFRPFCSGVVLSPTMVATSLHCFTESGLSAPNVAFSVGLQVSWGKSYIPQPSRDYAVVMLAQSLAPTMPANYARPKDFIDPEAAVGREVTCYGRGNVLANGGPDYYAPWTSGRFLITRREGPNVNGGFWIQKGIGTGAVVTFGDSGGPCFFSGPGSTPQNMVLVGNMRGGNEGVGGEFWAFVQTYGS